MTYPKKLFFKNYVFFVAEKVYEPAEDTFLLAENMKVKETDVVLDVGTGCGVLAVLAAEKAKKVLGVDINPHAVRCAEENAEINGFEKKTEFRSGDLFKPIKPNETFDLMIFNAPYLPSDPYEERSLIVKSRDGGPNGRKIIERFVKDAPKFLRPRGRILLVQSSISDISRTFKTLREASLKARIVASIKASFEKIVLIEARHASFV